MITVVPVVDPPVTTPLSEPIVATDGMLLLHNPPGTISKSVVVVDPVHAVAGPRIGPGVGLTVTTLFTEQPVGNVYTIVVVPVAMPVTIPVVAPTVAVPGELLSHVPPGVGSASMIVEPTHTAEAPDMAPGKGLTTMFTLPVIVRKHPVTRLVAITV